MADFIIKLLIALAGAGGAALIKNYVVPIYIERYKEPTQLKKIYFGTLYWPNEEDHVIKLEIKKTGYDVKGDLTFIRGKHSGKIYSIKGKYSHGLLSFTYEPVDKGSTSFGTGFFQRREDGYVFLGRFSYISMQSSNIESIECELRAPEDQAPLPKPTTDLIEGPKQG